MKTSSLRRCGSGELIAVGGVWQNFNQLQLRPNVSLITGKLFQGWLQGNEHREMNSVYIQVCLVTALMVTSNGVYLVIACFVMETACYCKLSQA